MASTGKWQAQGEGPFAVAIHFRPEHVPFFGETFSRVSQAKGKQLVAMSVDLSSDGAILF
jgi:hypothetical protein